VTTQHEHLSPYAAELTTMPTTIPTTARPGLRPRSEAFRASGVPRIVPSSASTKRLQGPSRASRCAEVARRAGTWINRRRYELAPFGATTALTFASWWAYADGAGPGSIAICSALGALSTAGTVFSLKHKNPQVAHATAALALVFGDVATGMAAGPGPYSLLADGILTGTAYAFYGPKLVQLRHERMKLHVDTVKARGALPSAMGLEAADPGLVGSSPEETALRRALHALTGVTPLDVPAFQHHDNGWAALVIMPAGKNTAPDQIIRKKAQLASNLGLPGTLHLTRGDDDNQLVVRLVTSDALAGTIPYADDDCTSMAEPIRLGLDEHGNPVNIVTLYRHTLIAGASDWGKSGLSNLIIKRMARRADVDIYGIDMKPGTVELGPWEPLMKRLARNVHGARELFDYLDAEAARRGKILADLSAESLAGGGKPVRKWIPGVHGNGIIFVIDELAELIRQDEALRRQEAEWRKGDPEGFPVQQPLSTRYESGLALWRFLAMSAVACTQQPSRKVFGGNTDARGNYANRLSTRMGEPGHGPLIFGQGSQTRGWRPELLDLPGKFLVATPELENTEPRVCRAEYVSDQDIADDVSHLHARSVPSTLQAKAPVMPVRLPALLYPDGTTVERDGQPDLYREFQQLGSATKKELQKVGPFSSRDTVGRAIEVWQQHGVQARKEGRAERFYLPEIPNSEAG
jgi:hypothetical protein